MPQSNIKLADLIESIASKSGQTQATVKAVLLAEQEVVGHELARGNEVPAINGAVKLSVSERAARTGRNPRTGEEIPIPAKKVVKVKIAKKLQDVVG